MSTNIPRGNVLGIWVAAVTFDPANIAAAGSSEQDITVKGAKVGDLAFVSKPTATAAMGVCSARVKSADTVAVTFIATAAANGGSEVYNVLVIRPDGTPGSVLPGA